MFVFGILGQKFSVRKIGIRAYKNERVCVRIVLIR